MRTAVVLQSNYLPWKGYFQLADEADVFVFYDDVQYTKNDWRNRNRVKAHSGLVWLTVPVLHTGHAEQTILDARVREDLPWRRTHRRTVEQSYRRAPHWAWAEPLLDEVWGRPWDRLAELNRFAVRRVAERIGIDTEFVDVETLGIADDDPTRRLVRICAALGCDAYLSGPAAADYLEPAQFAEAGIALRWAEYAHLEYPQLHGPFEHRVSIVDTLVHCGPDTLRHVRRAR